MNILFISNLTGNMWAGPNNSVPAQIVAQSKIDNVFWYNVNYNKKKEWVETGFFFNFDDYPGNSIFKLPDPFSRPDLVIFEGIYEYKFSKIALEVQKYNIPYILIPRSQLTKKAQSNKRIKKKVGNLIFFKKFIKNATAIQYLTQKELNESGMDWNKSCIVIPNGINQKNINSIKSDDASIKGIYIGRIEIYQKGLDMLVEACIEMQNEMRKQKCTIDLYGPDRDGAKEKLMKMISEAGIQDLISINDGIFDLEKERVQREADFFIMTSRFEGHPMGLIEALSYGLPSLVSAGTNMADEVKLYNAGWTCKSNVESIKKALLNMINSKEQIQEMSLNAINLSTEYDWDKIARLSHKEYFRLIKETRG